MVRLPDSVNTLAHDVSSNVASLAHDVSSNVSSLAQDVAPKVSSLAQDVASRAQDAAHVAGKHGRRWGRKAVAYGRDNLGQVGGTVKPKQSHRGRNLLLIVLTAVGAVVIVKILKGRSDDAWQPVAGDATPGATHAAAHDEPASANPAPDADRRGDNNHVDTA